MKKYAAALLLCALAGTAYGQGRSIRGAGEVGTDASASNVIGDSGEKYQFYVGMDYQFLTLAVLNSSGAGGFPQKHYNGRLYDLRFGYRLFKTVGLELHYGVDGGNDNRSNGFGVTRYYGIYVVPTATVLNTVELSLPLGYAFTGVKQRVPGQPEYRASINSAAFGANIELPIREFGNSLPNLRLTGGGVVYIQRNNAQIYGFHLGIRYDFGFGSNAAPAAPEASPAAASSDESGAGGSAPGGGAPGGGVPGGGAPGGGAPGGSAPAGGVPGGGAPGGGAPAGGDSGGAAPSGGAPAAPAGGAPPV